MFTQKQPVSSEIETPVLHVTYAELRKKAFSLGSVEAAKESFALENKPLSALALKASATIDAAILAEKTAKVTPVTKKRSKSKKVLQ